MKAFKHPRYGFGIYEGQCDKTGSICGEGRWYCTEPSANKPEWKGCIIEGCFKGNLPEGFSKIFIKYHLFFLDCFKNIEGGLAYGESIDGVKVGKASNFK